MTKIQRPIAYMGSKWGVVDWLSKFVPCHTCYVEPFGGSAALLLTKVRTTVEVYNDLDSLVVNFWRVLRTHPEELINAVELTPYSREEHEHAWTLTMLEEITKRDPARQDLDTQLELARAFVIRSWQTRSGYRKLGRTAWRTQKTGATTSPASKWKKVPEKLRPVAERLKGVCIEHDDALAVMRRYDSPETLHFVDPPYLHSTRTSWERYRVEFDRHEELLATVTELAGMVLLSGYESPLYAEHLSHWRLETIARRSTKQNEKIEHLWINPAAASRLADEDTGQLLLFGG